MNDIAISVIIPVYNVEQFLKRCVESVISQQGVTIEIMLVDDGSTDGSPSICDEYARQYEKINVIHKKNEGLGFARNTGIENTSGEYLFFLDSDDWIPPNTLQELHELATQREADIVSFRLFRTNRTEVFKVENEQPILRELSPPDIIGNYLENKIATTACSKLYKRSIFERVRFSKVALHEDAWSMHLFLQEAHKVLITNQIYYVQYVRTNSLIQSSFREDNLISLECGRRLIDFVDEKYGELPAFHTKALECYMEREISLLVKMLEDGKSGRYRQQYMEITRSLREQVKIIPCEKMEDEYIREWLTLFIYHPRYFYMRFRARGVIRRTRVKIGILKRRLQRM